MYKKVTNPSDIGRTAFLGLLKHCHSYRFGDFICCLSFQM